MGYIPSSLEMVRGDFLYITASISAAGIKIPSQAGLT
jgi:hypothetical protein